MNIKKIIGIIIVIGLFAGCIQTKEDYYVNPDGSGKLYYQATLPLGNNFMGQNSTVDPEKIARKSAGNIIEKSKGIETWSDVSFKVNEEGKLHFEGTAYFKNLNDVTIGGNIKSSTGEQTFEKLGDGSIKIILSGFGKKKTDNKTYNKELTGEELKNKIVQEKIKYEQSKAMMAMFMTGLRIEKNYHLPGSIEEVKVMRTSKDETAAGILYEGDKILAALNKLTATDEWWENQVKSGNDLNKGGDIQGLDEELFGEAGPAYVKTVSDIKPIFDYDSEVKEAKKNYDAMLEKLNIKPVVKILPPAKGDGFKSIKVGGVRLITFSDNDNNIRPFNYDKGYSLSLIGEFSGSVLKVKEAKVLEAVADNGESLISDKYTYIFPQLSKDKRFVVFDAELKVPDENIKQIKKISGTVTYLTSGKETKIDLGLVNISAGAAVGKIGEIKSIQESEWQKGKYEFTMKLKMDKNAIKKILFYDEKGNELDIKEGSYSQFGEELTINFVNDSAFPSKAKIVIDTYEDMKQYITTFELNDISLFGEKIK